MAPRRPEWLFGAILILFCLFLVSPQTAGAVGPSSDRWVPGGHDFDPPGDDPGGGGEGGDPDEYSIYSGDPDTPLTDAAPTGDGRAPGPGRGNHRPWMAWSKIVLRSFLR